MSKIGAGRFWYHKIICYDTCAYAIERLHILVSIRNFHRLYLSVANTLLCRETAHHLRAVSLRSDLTVDSYKTYDIPFLEVSNNSCHSLAIVTNRWSLVLQDF